MQKDIIKEKYLSKFGTTSGTVYAAPGRINLIGEHTDYNEGYVFPGAIDKCIIANIDCNNTMTVCAYSIDIDEYVEFDLQNMEAPTPMWARYIYGVCREMQDKGIQIKGFNTVFAGDIPLGAGMSSSAALESCYAFALNDIFGANIISKMDLAKIGQNTEHKYVGVNCGIMDQFASVFGKEGYLMRLDCRSMEHEYFPFAPHKDGYRVVLLDSVVKHELVDSPYNKRRESCEHVSKTLGVVSLREASIDNLKAIKSSISEEDFKRAKYVIEEKQRVLDVCQALKVKDYETVGACMYKTHKGLSEDYEVSCEELDFLNEIALVCGVSGSRIMGGGFGGCTINLVKKELCETFIERAKKLFINKFGHAPKVYEVIISDGARRID
ncbi:MAG: galactokinase [Muribaculaceae bacterium]